MSDLVEAVSFAGDTPWHGLGFKVDPDADINTWKEQAGFNWEIKDCDVKRVDDDAIIEGTRALYRSDTRKNLSVVKSGYNIVQPQKVLEFFQELVVQRGFKMHTIGTLNDGKVFWALVKTGLSEVIANDEHKVEQFVLLAGSADRSLSGTGQYTVIEESSNNTLQLTIDGGSMRPRIRVKHTRKFNEAQAKQILNLEDHVENWKDTVDILNRLSDIKVNDPVSFYKNLLARDNADKEHPRIIETLVEIYEGSGPGQASIIGTAYGLVNAVARYVDFYRGRTDKSRLFNAFFGPGCALKNRSVEMALKLAA